MSIIKETVEKTLKAYAKFEDSKVERKFYDVLTELDADLDNLENLEDFISAETTDAVSALEAVTDEEEDEDELRQEVEDDEVEEVGETGTNKLPKEEDGEAEEE